jgi:hypothetical protein
VEEIAAKARANPELQVRVIDDKTYYFVPKEGKAPTSPTGWSNSQKGMIIIEYRGKFSTFMNGNFGTFRKFS